MSQRVTMAVTMELLTDAIFGSGHSIPGGEDVAVCRTEAGYPYLKGSTLKGLLKESVENWLAWTGGQPALVQVLFGKEDWNGEAQDRRVQLTELTLLDAPADPEACFGTRIFTSLENGVVKERTLREAACVNRGLRFSGSLTCAQEDTELLTAALGCIKWAGTMRSRGFGEVKLAAGKPVAEPARTPLAPTGCIHYRLRTMLPVQITDLGRSYGNGYETRSWIPGTAVRGAVMSALAQAAPDWFEANKTALLTGTRFLDAVPDPLNKPVLPSIKGFYEDKQGGGFSTVVIDGTFDEGLKRAKLGTFCAVEGEKLLYWSGRTGGVTRIRRGTAEEPDSLPFQTRYLEAGQELDGYILLDRPELAEAISGAMPETMWLGADRYEGFGQCRVTTLEAADGPDWEAAYGYGPAHQPGEVLYLLTVTPFTMVNDWGEPCGLEPGGLAELLGVGRLTVEQCATSMSEYGNYNRSWKCREPQLRMYDRGSIFKLVCDRAPELEKLLALQRRGLGARTESGFGQVLFLRRELFEQISCKDACACERVHGDEQLRRLRLARYDWVRSNRARVNELGLSGSQLGSIQSLCEQALRLQCSTEQLDTFMEKNLSERGEEHAVRFRRVKELLDQVLDRPLSDTLGVACNDSVQDRLKLLILLFNHSRKGVRA